MPPREQQSRASRPAWAGFRMVGEQPVTPTRSPPRLPGQRRFPPPVPSSEEEALAIARGIIRHSSHDDGDRTEARHSLPPLRAGDGAAEPRELSESLLGDGGALGPLDERSYATEHDWRSNAAWDRAKEASAGADSSGSIAAGDGNDGAGDDHNASSWLPRCFYSAPSRQQTPSGRAAPEVSRDGSRDARPPEVKPFGSFSSNWNGLELGLGGWVSLHSPTRSPKAARKGGWTRLASEGSNGTGRWSVLESAQHAVGSSWARARQVLVAQQMTRKSLFSRQLGSIILSDQNPLLPAFLTRGDNKGAKRCITWSCAWLVLVPLLIAFTVLAITSLTSLAFVAWPWLRDGSTGNGCHASPVWMSNFIERRIDSAISQIDFPQPVLGNNLKPRADVLGVTVKLKNVSLESLEINAFELSACYEDDVIALPLLMPARSTAMKLSEVHFGSRAEYEVYGAWGALYLGSGYARVSGRGQVTIETDPLNLQHFVTSCDATFDEEATTMEVHGFGEGTPFASKGFLNTIVDFDMLMCEGRGDNSIYNFEGDRVFRGVPTEVNAVVLKEVPVLHRLLRFAFFLLSLLALALVLLGFCARCWLSRVNRQLWGQRTVEFYLRRWLGARHYALFIWLFKRVAVLTVAGTLAAVVVLGACYFLTDETVAFAPSQDGNGGKRRCAIGGSRSECEDELPSDVDPMLEEAILQNIPGTEQFQPFFEGLPFGRRLAATHAAAAASRPPSLPSLARPGTELAQEQLRHFRDTSETLRLIGGRVTSVGL